MKLAKELGLDMSAIKPEQLDALVSQLESVAQQAYESMGEGGKAPAKGIDPWWDLIKTIEQAQEFRALLHKASHAVDALPNCSMKVTMLEVIVVFGVELAKSVIESAQLEGLSKAN